MTLFFLLYSIPFYCHRLNSFCSFIWLLFCCCLFLRIRTPVLFMRPFSFWRVSFNPFIVNWTPILILNEKRKKKSSNDSRLTHTTTWAVINWSKLISKMWIVFFLLLLSNKTWSKHEILTQNTHRQYIKCQIMGVCFYLIFNNENTSLIFVWLFGWC